MPKTTLSCDFCQEPSKKIIGYVHYCEKHLKEVERNKIAEHPLERCICCPHKLDCDCFKKTVRKMEAAIQPDTLPLEEWLLDHREKALNKGRLTAFFASLLVFGWIIGMGIGYVWDKMF